MGCFPTARDFSNSFSKNMLCYKGTKAQELDLKNKTLCLRAFVADNIGKTPPAIKT
jgi:hypothetical protein